MPPASRWRIAAVPAAALLIGTSPLYADRFALPPFLFVPLALAGLAAAAYLGVQRAPSASRWTRLRRGCLWAAVWVGLVPLPAAFRSGLFLWAAHSAPAPPGATYVLAPGNHVEYGLFGERDLTECGGYQVVWRSNLSTDAVERFYRERLGRRGWGLHWTREVSVSGSVVRMLCFRRADGFLTLRVGAYPDGNASFGLLYDHAGSPGRYR